MIKIITDGRTDVEDYFRLSGIFDYEELNHTPLLVFIPSENTVKVRIVHKPIELLSLSDELQVMGQWRGEWRSDFFQFTIGQFIKYFESKYDHLKNARNVIKRVGQRGGFHSLSYEYMNEHGTITHSSNHSKAEAERLEDFFKKHNISIQIKME